MTLGNKQKKPENRRLKAKKLGGIQLFAPKGWKTTFIEAYIVKGIPRFILIDRDLSIIYASAPRPSDPSLRIVFDQLMP